MMKKPLILLTFSNQQKDHLPNLDKERKEIKEKLSPAVQQGQIILEHESATNTDDIFKYFDQYRGQVKIFHFGGHADPQNIILDGKTANGKALAELLAEENKLGGIELVFLNGCATYGHVAQILAAGVKAVIATSVKVKDTEATDFAIQFYQSFAEGASIQEAYHRASTLMKTKNATDSRFLRLGEIRYSELLPEAQQKADDTLPWALYCKESDRPNLLWSLKDIKMTNLENFKKELIDLVENAEYKEVFEKINKSHYTYDKFLLNRLQKQIAFKVEMDLIDQLKVFIGTLKEPS
ncbi:MAG: CHAT domain-containing protein [Microscillaceae bacterium]|nr:CHAT domain-containing protein [Microscillaceae bacterium]